MTTLEELCNRIATDIATGEDDSSVIELAIRNAAALGVSAMLEAWDYDQGTA